VVINDTRLAYESYCHDTVGLPSDLQFDGFPAWLEAQKSLFESTILDEKQTLFKMRLVTLQKAFKALHAAQLNLPSNDAEYYSSVDSILSVYLGEVSKRKIAKADHDIFSDYAAY
jgi:hypothetical protein